MDLSPAEIVVALEHVQLFQYVDVASIAILIFDYFLTLDLEILYIWPSRWSGMKCMFLITRYLPIFESALLLSQQIQVSHTPFLIIRIFLNVSWIVLILVGIVIAEIILSMRTWAVWGKDRKIGIGLLIFSLASVIPSIPVILHFSNTAQFVNPPLAHYRGCFLVGGSRILSIDWILLMGYDAGMFSYYKIDS
ncbi:hypothetical protein BDQ12DRAFT_760853 [Crucibulum laeve]|uniref:DUF6533 domain-containing protein n=1 Tax=Crucibulum laeve TaxID=68775 RepID=A0A5C3M1U4_9AGAR|nr:hypothetical protein BDQ12DRAFT_760853 [Crucibulum laeve]